MANSLVGLAPVNPDAQQTVNDFLDYTEFFPSDTVRSLTLIRKLDELYLGSTDTVHELTKTYGSLPKLPSDSRRSAQGLRTQISLALDHAIRCRESAFTEASRLYEVADRHYNRITSIKRKLHALPKPPSRDPTPVPPSPQVMRARKTEVERTRRLTLHFDGARQGNGERFQGNAEAPKQRSRKITVPGEVLLPPNPDSPPPSTVSDWTSRRSSPAETSSNINIPKPKFQKIKLPKIPKIPRLRQPGSMGTNVHSSVAGISVSNALAQLEPPPPDAKLGSRYRPWHKLTEYEMAKLRKRMKKNAIWNPSDTMVRRELADLGRGHSNFLKAKAEAERTGETLLNEEPVPAGTRMLMPGEVEKRAMDDEELKLVNRGMKLNEAKKLKKETQAKELAAQNALEMEDVGNRMRMEAQTATEIEEAGRRIKDAGDMFKSLFSRPPAETGETLIIGTPFEKKTETASKSAKKRKRESSQEGRTEDSAKQSDPSSSEPLNRPLPKKLKLAVSAPPPLPVSSPRPPLATTVTRTTTTQVPLAPAGPSSPKRAAPSNRPPSALSELSSPAKNDSAAASETPTVASSTRSRRTSAGPQKPPAPPPQIAPTPTRERFQQAHPVRSRRSSVAAMAAAKAASAEPPSKRLSLRRGSNASLPLSGSHDAKRSPAPGAVPTPRLVSRRARRPAPGIVTADGDGGTKVSVGKRAAPRKGSRKEGNGNGKAGEKAEEKPSMEEEWDDVDPDEPRYCLCNRVSFGTMIACENDDCEIEWFHLGCVGLDEKPGRRVKWYCPDCRKKLHIDEHGNAANLQGSTRKR